MAPRTQVTVGLAVVAAIVLAGLAVAVLARDDRVAGAPQAAATAPSTRPTTSTPSGAEDVTSVPLAFDDGSGGVLIASGHPDGPVTLTIRPKVDPAAGAELDVSVSIDESPPLAFPVTRSRDGWTGQRIVPAGDWMITVAVTSDEGGFTTTSTASSPLQLPE